jgi:preprotein translocase subunit SecB
MLLSPIQLKSFYYLLLKIELDYAYKPDPEQPQARWSELIQESIGEQVGFNELTDGEGPNGLYAVRLGIRLQNETEKVLPYNVEVQAVGLFEWVDKSVTDAEKKESLIRVNGLSIVYGAIRDQICTTTGRFPHGPMLLPTMNFMDHKMRKEPVTSEAAQRVPGI